MAVPGNLSGEEGAPVKLKREMEWGGRWAPMGGTREHLPQQGAPTPLVLPAHPGQSQHGWTWAPRNSSDPQPPHKASPPQHVPSPGMFPSPWQDGADVGRCSPCFSPLDHKGVSYNTQKRGLTGDQHTFGFFFFSSFSFISLLLAVSPR